MTADWRDVIRDELELLEDDLHYTERTHFSMESAYRSWHNRGGVAAALLSAGAGATILADWSAAIAGASALLAALVSSVLTFMRPERRAQEHLSGGRRLADLRGRVRHTLRIDLPVADFGQMRERLEELRQAKVEVDATLPPTSDRHFSKARERIQRGLYEKDARPAS